MTGTARSALEYASFGLELAGVFVIIAGAVVATFAYLRDPQGLVGGYDRYRANLGRGILLGLELLVGADIIATVSAPLTYESVGLLAAIVLIRTFLSFALETEIKGRLPWRGKDKDEEM